MSGGPTPCPVCRLLRSAAPPVDPRFELDPADLPARSRWCPVCLVRDMEHGHFDPSFRRFFNRDPERRAPGEPGVVVSPADGILEISDEGPWRRFLVHIRLTDVHVQRAPLAGVVSSVERSGVGYYPPLHGRHLRGVQAVTTLESEIGPCRVAQITSHLTSRIRTFLKPGDSVARGQRLGRILLGSTAVLEAPRRVEPAAPEGTRVYAGETILARY